MSELPSKRKFKILHLLVCMYLYIYLYIYLAFLSSFKIDFLANTFLIPDGTIDLIVFYLDAQ